MANQWGSKCNIDCIIKVRVRKSKTSWGFYLSISKLVCPPCTPAHLVGVQPPVLQLLLKEWSTDICGVVQLPCAVVVQDLGEYHWVPGSSILTFYIHTSNTKQNVQFMHFSSSQETGNIRKTSLNWD